MKNFVLFAALIFSQSAFSQDTYYKSSIITLQNDTIKGFVSNIYDSKTFTFKKKLSDKPIDYTPRQLRGVILDGNVFESRFVKVPYYKTETVSMGASGTPCLEKDNQRGFLKDTVFLHKIVNGEVSLFKFRNREGFTYYLVEKNKVLKDLPPRYCFVEIDSNSVRRMLNKRLANLNTADAYTVYTYIKDDYLDTLGLFLNDRRFITTPAKMYKYSEKSLTTFVSQYNKKKGITNGGVLKTKINRKIFTGINAGLVYLNYDPQISDADFSGSYAIKLYGLYALSGANRNIFMKFGVNYFTYRNEFYKKAIPSASFGLRYSSVSGYFRPYAEASLAVASLNRNNRPIDVGFPMLLEVGGNIPIKNFFLTVGATYTPVMVYKLNGYKLWAFNIGVMF